MKCTFCGARVPTGDDGLCAICADTPAAQPGALASNPMDVLLGNVVRNNNAALNAVFGRTRT